LTMLVGSDPISLIGLVATLFRTDENGGAP